MISQPQSLEDYYLVWLSPNDTQIIPESSQLNPETGDFHVRLPIDLTKLNVPGEDVRGYLVGKDAIKTPFWIPLPIAKRIYLPSSSGELNVYNIYFEKKYQYIDKCTIIFIEIILQYKTVIQSLSHFR